MFSQANLSSCMKSFVMGLLDENVRQSVISPGSRNFPIIKALHFFNDEIELHSIVDERSAGYVGIGLIQATQAPVMICCTSGTAALNYYPAVAEAFYAKQPLIIVTADRPKESIDNWEGQSIRQNKVFEQHTCASYNISVNQTNQQSIYKTARDAVRKSKELGGPVHINLPFTEPFYSDWDGDEDVVIDGLNIEEKHTEPSEMSGFRQDLQKAKSILWLNGASHEFTQFDYPENLVVFSDVISGKNETINYWDSILLTKKTLDLDLSPDMIITTGMYFVSKKLRLFFAAIPNLKHYHVGNEKHVPTPFQTNPTILNLPILKVLDEVQECYQNTEFKASWEHEARSFEGAFTKLNWNLFSEFSAIKTAYKALNPKSILQISSSMPIRYVGYLQRRNDIKHYSNRGTSGIDGSTSTAVGFAMKSKQEVVLFTGDVAFLYDSNALWNRNFPSNLKIVVFNNNGGGIFELIEGPSIHREVLPLQTTNHAMNMKSIVDQFGISYSFLDSITDMKQKIKDFLNTDGAGVLEIQTKREANKMFYEQFKSIDFTEKL